MKIKTELTPAEFDQAVDNFKYMCKCALEVVIPVLIVWGLIFCIARGILSFS